MTIRKEKPRKPSRILKEFGENALAGNSFGVRVGRKRTDEQREADLALIARLLVRENLTRNELAIRVTEGKDYTLSDVQITHDVKELYRRWRDAYLDDIDILKGRELRRVDELEAAYWKSYERSLQGTSVFREDVTEFTKEEERDAEDMIGVSDNESAETVAKKIKRNVSRRFQSERDGEVRFLNGIQWCIDKRCEILGLNAPLKAEMTFDWRSEAQREGIDPSIIFNEAVKKFVDGNVVDGDVKELTEGQ